MPTTDQQQLDKVNAAIDAIMDGGAVQSYTINGRRIDKIPLDQLLKMQADLERKIDSTGSRRTYAKFTNPR